MEKSTKLGHSKGSGIAGNPECDGVGAMVGSVQSLASASNVCECAAWCICVVIGLGGACQPE